MDLMLQRFVEYNTPFILYSNCSVEYDGRAHSKLSDGKYLVIFKQDGSLQIHGANKISPRNYQCAKSTLEYDNDTIICFNKKDRITINVREIVFLANLEGWSANEIQISKTEKDLVDKLCAHVDKYIDIRVRDVILEYKTNYGPVDIVFIDDQGAKHVVEVKRRKATIKDGTQLRKYLECIGDSYGYVAAPAISDKALNYLRHHDCGFIKVTFDD
jgi:endonuclease